ncbi:MAG: Trm112 family protein [Gemmatimonadetes bacterium]|uniref:Trm112 family protein n=1 Tax=Candidatus Kutchimonas denitrificans TaxID=3056748 RepID=A0AAE5CDB8_9BACT|nr:Trm112 family protein [Gemmatimonadota bacterium]NIR75479.1 Trm112 family protein [Candidatus Kutchimonas denitrificans]NIS01793.1 Trm112 family protein [Gemmatimonadota bacterium]NIT67574.1 Trm112 family protein [Gemmatimonadota bacterium]NIU53448.1 hypothetical protein [Gemmatimonadota bacterium]
MFFELTDLLTCPRCGPQHGLVLLVKDVEDRRVREGWLGCPNCRNDYPVEAGVADLRLAPGPETEAKPPYHEEELSIKIMALSGLEQEKAVLALDGRLAHAASAIVERAPELEIIVLLGSRDAGGVEAGVSRIMYDVEIPLAERALRCIALAPGGDPERVAAASRRVAGEGRLVLFDAREEDIEAAKSDGLTVLAAEGSTAVAERRSGSLPIVG